MMFQSSNYQVLSEYMTVGQYSTFEQFLYECNAHIDHFNEQLVVFCQQIGPTNQWMIIAKTQDLSDIAKMWRIDNSGIGHRDLDIDFRPPRIADTDLVSVSTMNCYVNQN